MTHSKRHLNLFPTLLTWLTCIQPLTGSHNFAHWRRHTRGGGAGHRTICNRGQYEPRRIWRREKPFLAYAEYLPSQHRLGQLCRGYLTLFLNYACPVFCSDQLKSSSQFLPPDKSPWSDLGLTRGSCQQECRSLDKQYLLNLMQKSGEEWRTLCIMVLTLLWYLLCTSAQWSSSPCRQSNTPPRTWCTAPSLLCHTRASRRHNPPPPRPRILLLDLIAPEVIDGVALLH